MAISRKHFKLIADELKIQKPYDNALTSSWEVAPALSQWEDDVKAVAKALAKLNTRFDYGRFYEACGLQTKEKAA